jgi:4-amino-4-deoxy-L-arabinose transferase-like glycosyltransferase
VLAVAAVAFVNAACWALLTPAWHGPDEPHHFAFAQNLAENGRAPDKQPSDSPAFSTATAFALDATRTFSTVELADVKPPWLEADEERYRELLRDSPELSEQNGGGYLFPSSPHSPAYYGVTLLGYAPADGGSPFTQLTAMRVISALLGALAAACGFLAMRELAPRTPWLAVAVGLLMAFQPMFAFMFGVVNNDAGVNAAAALVIYLLIRGLRRGLTVPLGLALGAALVALPAMKGTGFALYPAAVVGLAGMVRRRRRRADLPAYAAVAGAGSALAGLWAFVAGRLDTEPFTTPGGGAGAGLSGTVERVLDAPSGFLSYTWQTFLPRLSFMADLRLQGWPAYDIYIQGGWAAFGWLVARFPPWVYQVIAAVSLLAAALCALAVWRERRQAHALGWELSVLLLVLAGVVGGVAAVYFTTTPTPNPAEQGRYIFTALVPLAAIAAGSSFAFGRRLAPVWGTALVAAVMGLGYASQVLTLAWFFT